MGHCGVKYRDPLSAGLANCEMKVFPDALPRGAGFCEKALGGADCCANVISAVAKTARTPMAHAAI